ncbi:ArsR/SmtB family transcription factor [Streptomyces yaizuensis]|uniref:Winged helix-turn-helix domain-containing protein n=1 Tax=Streptomyces yaizuensis TaxID=2989713 RepID=A0ABQ5NXP5_9ACTN|nr:winged helix-turn-helix domain-containing protein [Streptomyces sp. YSPA8]GLF94928.1 winged helix-turn-helix domain-containing protein [Streptomyces sp. YSPA8]
MVRIHFTAADFTQVRFAPRPAPLAELHTALMTMCRPDQQVLFGRWRQRMFRCLPGAAGPLRDLVPGAEAPRFLDVFSETLQDARDTVRAFPPDLVRSEIERIHAPHPSPVPLWIRDLHQGEPAAWHLLHRAQHAAFETVVRPVWNLVQDLHRTEFTRHALTVAEHGIGAALTGGVPGARLHGDVWELEGPERDITLAGRGVLLRPTFHWTGHPLVADLPGHPLVVTFPAGPGLPLAPAGAKDTTEALAGVLGRTRADILLRLADEHTTTLLARRLGISNATASAHTTALRAAGLITTVRAGRAVVHRRTALGSLLVHHRTGPQGAPDGSGGEPMGQPSGEALPGRHP